MLEPKALPSAKPGLPCRDERAEITISGIELPKPIISMPMRRGGQLNLFAVAAAPSTNLSALYTSKIIPPTTASNGISINVFRGGKFDYTLRFSCRVLTCLYTLCNFKPWSILHLYMNFLVWA